MRFDLFSYFETVHFQIYVIWDNCYGKNVAAHIEYSRMLAEHGVFGLASLMLLFITPIAIFNNINNPDKKTIMILFGLLAILTMTHSAMRIAMPCLMYSFIFPKFKL